MATIYIRRFGDYTFIVEACQIRPHDGKAYQARITRVFHQSPGAMLQEVIPLPRMGDHLGETTAEASSLAVDAIRAWILARQPDAR
jgi:hypothetical protein